MVVDQTGERVISLHEVPWVPETSWYEIAYELQDREVTVVLDTKNRLPVGQCGNASGDIGLVLYGQIEVRFDDVAVHSMVP